MKRQISTYKETYTSIKTLSSRFKIDERQIYILLAAYGGFGIDDTLNGFASEILARKFPKMDDPGGKKDQCEKTIFIVKDRLKSLSKNLESLIQVEDKVKESPMTQNTSSGVFGCFNNCKLNRENTLSPIISQTPKPLISKVETLERERAVEPQALPVTSVADQVLIQPYFQHLNTAPKPTELCVSEIVPWEKETDDLLRSRMLSSISIMDHIITFDQMRNLKVGITLNLTKLVLSNIFTARTTSEMNYLLSSLSLNIGLLPSLVDVDVSHNALSANVGLLFPFFHSAIRLNICDCGLAVEDFNSAAEHFSSGITYLKADRNYLSGYPIIERLQSLEILDLRSNRIPREHLNHLLPQFQKSQI